MSKLLIATEYTSASQNSTGYIWSRIITKLFEEGLLAEVLSPSVPIKYESFEGDVNLFFKLIKQLWVAYSLAFKILKCSDSSSIVFTGTNPCLLLCIIPLLIMCRRFQWVLLVHDVFPENLVASGLVNDKSILFKLLTVFFDWIYSFADILICIGRDMECVMEGKTSNKGKSVYLPYWVDENDVYPLPRDLEVLGIENRVVFQFFGNIGRVQGIQSLLQAIAMVKSKNAAFVFIGGGALVSDVKEFIRLNPSRKVIYLGSFPLTERNKGLSLCDVALVSLEENMLGLGVPSKVYFSMAAGKPILAAVEANSEIGQMLNEYPVGWRCDPGSSEQLASMIDRICCCPSLLSNLHPRDVFLRNYSEKIVLKKLISLLMGRLSFVPRPVNN